MRLHVQGDPAYNEQAQMKEGQGLTLTLTLWDQDCVVTVDELSKLPLPKLCKLYTVSTSAAVLVIPKKSKCLPKYLH